MFVASMKKTNPHSAGHKFTPANDSQDTSKKQVKTYGL